MPCKVGHADLIFALVYHGGLLYYLVLQGFAQSAKLLL